MGLNSPVRGVNSPARGHRLVQAGDLAEDGQAVVPREDIDLTVLIRRAAHFRAPRHQHGRAAVASLLIQQMTKI
eukprot:1052904-Pyramimonas_sp.AAC.1